MRYCAFIRNVMVGRNGLSQAVLVGGFTRCGATSVRSVLATGNVVFDFSGPRLAELTEATAGVFRAETGLAEPIYVRSFAQLMLLKEQGPFAEAPLDNVFERCVSFLPGDLDDIGKLPIRSPRGDAEVFACRPGAAFSITRLVKGRPGNPGALIERAAGIRVTTRKWETVERVLTK